MAGGWWRLILGGQGFLGIGGLVASGMVVAEDCSHQVDGSGEDCGHQVDGSGLEVVVVVVMEVKGGGLGEEEREEEGVERVEGNFVKSHKK